MATYRKIDVSSKYGARRGVEAAAALSPGHLLEYDSNLEVKKHSTAGGTAAPLFALTNFYDEITEAYAADDQVQVLHALPGDRVQARIANGQNISKGDWLESAGDGTLQKYAADQESIGTDSSGNVNSFPDRQIVGFACEDCDMSGSSAADPDGFCLIQTV